MLFCTFDRCSAQLVGSASGHRNTSSTFLPKSIPEASSFETCTLFLHTALKRFNTPTLHTLTNTHTVPTLSFQSASILPLLSYEAHSAGLHKDQREEFLKTVKSMPVIILPATKSNKSIKKKTKNMAPDPIIISLKYFF